VAVSLPTLTKRFGNMAQQSPPASSKSERRQRAAAAVALMDDLGEAAEDEAERGRVGRTETRATTQRPKAAGKGMRPPEDAADEEAEASAGRRWSPRNSGAPRTRRLECRASS